MKQAITIANDTDNSRVYNMSTRQYKTRCAFCPPNRGCNRSHSYYRRRSWKNYRTKQYKDLP